ncbi:LysE family transporter [Nocardiopsis sp. RSe5-2]|uniref:LysE family transporter n=1 Tax=Nocardiopsis endophytica TaxID=3018445 RepID=A0ABT4TYK4_9ACTN|nr:LysE family transporter [Nocardiopsis endophytica]MDA2809776.1 LysE family transporter [Nocardiopsis endophytica]
MPPRSWWPGLRPGLVTNAADPEAAVFAVSFLPQFVPSGAPVLPFLLVPAVLWTLVDLAWYGPAAWAVGLVRRAFARSAVRRWMEAVSGTVLVGPGVRVAAAAR